MSQPPGEPSDVIAARVLEEENRYERLWRRYGVLGWITGVWLWWMLFIAAVEFVSATTRLEPSVHWGVFAVAVVATTGYAFYAHYW